MGPLKDLVCPPYDVITPEEQLRLHERHPYNAVRIELPFSESRAPAERYVRAAAQFRDWLSTGVLTVDGSPSLYVYRQDFEVPAGGPGEHGRGRVAGVIGALELEGYGQDSGVLPHEETMPGPIEDRLALLRSCPVNISPIYAIYRGGGTLRPYLDSLEPRPPDARFVDYANTLHRVWAIRAPAELDIVQEAIAAGPMVIADGHHRYETALAYHGEQQGSPGGHDAVMCFCVDADAEDLVVWPFHRAIQAPASPDEVRERLMDSFATKVLTPDESPSAQLTSGADHPLVFVLPEEDLLVEISAEEVVAATGARSAAWSSLDVVALHELVLPALFPDGGVHDIVFTKDRGEVARLVAEQNWSTGVLLRPPKAADVIDVASSGERMPQKASYFWPKAVTGLVFRSLR
jgi:uncharacterized protein (DUF1015 family)